MRNQKHSCSWSTSRAINRLLGNLLRSKEIKSFEVISRKRLAEALGAQATVVDREVAPEEIRAALSKKNRINTMRNKVNDHKNKKGNKEFIRKPWKYIHGFLFHAEWVIYYRQ